MQRATHRFATLALVAAFFGASAQAQDLTATLVVSGLANPIDLESPPGDASRLVIAQQNGTIRLVKDGVLQATPFLDISPIVVSGGERGLLGIAFHPEYASNRKFYVSYTGSGGASIVRQYLRDASNPDVVDPTSFTTIFGPLSQPFSNHNGGGIKFGPDGKLYYALGDGGSGNDPGNRAQNPQNLLGKMLRFDVDLPFPHVPVDNPFVGDPSTLDLIWALGLRNPWRFGFDRVTGDLWIGDVGQNAREELNFQPASSPGGENYGWRCMEGLNCTGLSGCTCNSPSLTLPVHQYVTGGNCSIIGGFVYRGSLMPNMVGHFFFGDYCSGRIWTFVPSATGHPSGSVVDRTSNIGITGHRISSFAEDADGELYVIDHLSNRIFRLEEACAGQVASYCQSTTNSSGNAAVIGANGSTSVATNDFVLQVIGAAGNQSGLFFYGPTQVQAPFGDGFRCVGDGTTGVFRLGRPIMTDFFGDASRHWDFTQFPSNQGSGQVNAGDTWNAQFWFRDAGFGNFGFNLSDGLSVTFCP